MRVSVELQDRTRPTDFTHMCSSDVHFWHAGRIGPMVVEDKHILGHESAGEVQYFYIPFDFIHLDIYGRAHSAPHFL
jgi:hypothetical protein